MGTQHSNRVWLECDSCQIKFGDRFDGYTDEDELTSDAIAEGWKLSLGSCLCPKCSAKPSEPIS